VALYEKCLMGGHGILIGNLDPWEFQTNDDT
jgi:hypothetical protein